LICRQLQSGAENRLHEDPQMREQHNREHSVQVATRLFSFEFLVKCFVSKNRHASRNELNVVIPRVGNYLSMMGLFNHKSVTRTPWGKLDMHLFALHNRWNYPEVKRLMEPEATRFSIVRNPMDLFESLYGYMWMSRRFGISIHRFIQLIGQKKQDKFTNRRIDNIYGRNQLAWDLGITSTTKRPSTRGSLP
jgi:hypothetical protein